MKSYFSEVFQISEQVLNDYGAFDVSLRNDLPLFVDPFLLFKSDKKEYKKLHEDIITYLKYLKQLSENSIVSEATLRANYTFPELKQNWLGFSKNGNGGRGPGMKFARALHRNLRHVFRNFGTEDLTNGTHLEKLCLLNSGVGKDMISDFTNNLIKTYLLEYTEKFAREHIEAPFIKEVSINHAYFDYRYERWMPKKYKLPYINQDFILLTPKDMLTKDNTWINRDDLIKNFEDIPDSLDNEILREAVNKYLQNRLSLDEEPTRKEYESAVVATLERFPELLDYYIELKEKRGEEAIAISDARVANSYQLYVKQFGELASILSLTSFYQLPEHTKDETKQKINFFKDVIENKGGHKIFYLDGKPILKEADVHIMFRLTWHGTPSDVSREVNDGRGPADFKISRGAKDKTVVEFKLAANRKLKQNLEKQVNVYMKASDAKTGYKVIIYFSEKQLDRVERILTELKLENDPNVILVDARADNKPSGSVA